MSRPRLLACIAILFAVLLPSIGSAQEHQPQQRPGPESSHAAAAAQEEEHSEGVIPIIAKLFNFAALVGVLVYFLKTPLAGYLASRSSAIRQDLVTASEMRAAASEQLAEIHRKLESLPGELEALKVRGAEDVRAEQARITAAAAAERERLLEQTRREIDMHLRIARRELIELAAQLAVNVAEQRIKRALTPEDHLRLVDRYTHQLEAVR